MTPAPTTDAQIYDQNARAAIKLQEGGAAITPDDAGWGAWRAYFADIGHRRMLRIMASMEARTWPGKALTVPTVEPRDFDPRAPLARLEQTVNGAHPAAICRCDLGRQAYSEGWLPALYQFAKDHGRLPAGNEVAWCRDLEARNRRALKALTPSEERKTHSIAEQAKTFEKFRRLRRVMHERAHDDVFAPPPPKEAAPERKAEPRTYWEARALEASQ